MSNFELFESRGGIHTAICEMKRFNDKILNKPEHTKDTAIPTRCDCGCH